MVLPISTTHDQPAHPMLELNLLEFAEWLLADGSNFSLFQETSHYMPIISLLLSIIIHYISLFSHQIPMIFPSPDIPQIFFKYSSHILNYPLISSNILKYSSNILKYHLTSSNIFKYSSNTLKYPQIFLRYSSNIPHIFLTYPELSSDILKYPQIFLKYPQISSDIFKYIQIFLKYP
jgi:hypothetical protein